MTINTNRSGVQFQWSNQALERLKAGEIPETKKVAEAGGVKEIKAGSSSEGSKKQEAEEGVKVHWSSIGSQRAKLEGIKVATTGAGFNEPNGSKAINEYQKMQNTIDSPVKGSLFSSETLK